MTEDSWSEFSFSSLLISYISSNLRTLNATGREDQVSIATRATPILLRFAYSDVSLIPCVCCYCTIDSKFCNFYFTKVCIKFVIFLTIDDMNMFAKSRGMGDYGWKNVWVQILLPRSNHVHLSAAGKLLILWGNGRYPCF